MHIYIYYKVMIFVGFKFYCWWISGSIRLHASAGAWVTWSRWRLHQNVENGWKWGLVGTYIVYINTHERYWKYWNISGIYIYKYLKMTMEIDRPWNNGNNRTSRKNLWKVEFPLWRKQWYSKKNDNNDNFCCSIGLFVDYIDCFFPIVKTTHSNWHLLTFCGDDVLMTVNTLLDSMILLETEIPMTATACSTKVVF